MINVNDFKVGMTISYENNIYQVLEFQHVKPGKGAAIVKTKLKNLRTGSIVEQTFNAGIKVPTAHINKTKMQALYLNGDSFNYQFHFIEIIVTNIGFLRFNKNLTFNLPELIYYTE